MVKRVIDTRSPDALIAELATIEQRLKRAKDEEDFRRVHALLNEMRNSTRSATEYVRARYFYVRGLAYAKPVRAHKYGFLNSSATECLHYAFEVLNDDAKVAIERSAAEDPPGLSKLRRDCAYEAAAIYTVLNQWGGTEGLTLDMSSLDMLTRRKITNALKHHYSLSSRF